MTSSLRSSSPKELTQANGNKISLLESVDGWKLRYVLDHLEDFPQLAQKDLVRTWKGKTLDNDAQVTIMKKYLKKIKRGKVRVNYQQRDKRGRYFAQGGASLQSMSKVIRHTVASDYYWDVDIKNAHPVLLLQYCRRNQIASSCLERYVKNREGTLKAITDQCYLDRDGAKDYLLASINGGNRRPDQGLAVIPEIAEFHNELVAIRKVIMKLEPDLVKLCQAKLKRRGETEANLDGTVISHVMCDLENQCLIAMYNFLLEQGVQPDVLCFDGIMIAKEGCPEDRLSSLLTDCQEYVHKETGLSIALHVKPMELGLELPALNERSYDVLKTAFEAHSFKCVDRSAYYNTEHNMIRFKSRQDLMSAYENTVFVDGDGNTRSFIKVWLKDPGMRQYEFVQCLPPPLVCNEVTTYNLWSGFAVEATPVASSEARFQRLLDHIRLVCNNDDPTLDFVLKWLACLFQRPGAKNNIALLFKSKQGLGKERFYCMLERMIGSDYCGLTDRPEEDILGTFNSYLHNKILVVLDEFSGSVGYKYSDKLKSLITCSTLPVRQMRTDVRKEISFCKFMFFTNNDFPIKIEQGDRRYFVVNVAESVPPRAYFDRLQAAIDDPGALRMLYDYLMAMDISHVDWIQDRPATEYMNDLKTNSRDRELSFLIEKLQREPRGSTLTITGDELLQGFRLYCEAHYGEYKTTPNKFGMRIKSYGIDGQTKGRNNRGVVYGFDVDKALRWLQKEGHIPCPLLHRVDECD